MLSELCIRIGNLPSASEPHAKRAASESSLHASHLLVTNFSLASRLISHVPRSLLVFLSLAYRLLIVCFSLVSCFFIQLSCAFRFACYPGLQAVPWVEVASAWLFFGSCLEGLSHVRFKTVLSWFFKPTCSEMEAKIEAKTFPKTAKFRSRKQIPKMIKVSIKNRRFSIGFLMMILLVLKSFFSFH